MSGIQVCPFVPREEKKPLHPKRFTLFATFCCIFLIVIGVVIPSIGYHLVSNRYQRDMTLARTGISELETASQVFQVIRYDPFNLPAMYRAQNDFTDALIIFTRLNKDVPNAAVRLPIPSLRASKHLIQLGIEIARAGQATCNILTTMASHLAQYPQNEQENMPDRVASHVRMPRGIYARMPKKLLTSYNVLKPIQEFKIADIVRLKRNVHRIGTVLLQAQIHVQQLKPTDLQFDPRIEKAVSAMRLYLPLVQQELQQVEAFMAVVPLIAGITQPAHYLIKIRSPHDLKVDADLIGSYSLTLVGGRLTTIHAIDPLAAIEKGQLTGVITMTPALMGRILALHGPLAIAEYHEVITAQNIQERIQYHHLVETWSRAHFLPVYKPFNTLLGTYFMHYLQSLPSSLLPSVLQVLATSLLSKDLQVHFTSATVETAWQEMFSRKVLIGLCREQNKASVKLAIAAFCNLL